MEFKLTFDLLPVISVVLVFLSYYMPGFKVWFENLTQEWKQGFMLITLLVITVAMVALSVFGVLSVYPAEWKSAIMAAVVDFVIALMANAGIYKATDRINNNLSNKY